MNHYQEAEQQIGYADESGDIKLENRHLLAAQAHATLALVDKLDQLGGNNIVLDTSTLGDPDTATPDTPTFAQPGACQPVHTECVLPEGHDGDHIDTEGRYRDD